MPPPSDHDPRDDHAARRAVHEQFGDNAASYATSRLHATGASLRRLVEIAGPEPHWTALDIATGAGHTALAFAPHVAHVHAIDITPEMLVLARELAAERGADNLTIEHADAGDLPYDDHSFDLVTCRIAAHHFVDVDAFIREATRVLRPGGLLGVVDNVVPAGPAGDYVNAFERLRDPSHRRCLAVDAWLAAFTAAGLVVLHHETLAKEIEFEPWAARHDEATRGYLRAMLSEVAGEAAAFLQPRFTANLTTFQLREGIVVGRR